MTLLILSLLALGLFGIALTARRSYTKPVQMHSLRMLAFILLVMAMGFLSRFSETAKVHAQTPAPGTTVYQPNFWTAVSNYTALTVPSNSATLAFDPSTNQAFTIRQNQGSGWVLSITTSNNSSGNYTTFFDVNDDSVSNHWTGTNVHYLSWTVTLPNSNTQIFATNFTRDQLNNFRQVFPTLASNSCTTNGIKINFLHETHGNQ